MAKLCDIQAERAAISAGIDWDLYRRQRTLMHFLFPAAFTASGAGHKHPLALGIKADIIDTVGDSLDGFGPEEVQHFLRAYCFGPKYLLACKFGEPRLDLLGNQRGRVNSSQAWWAKTNLRAHVTYMGAPAPIAEAA